jgi:YHS domain-containing protein
MLKQFLLIFTFTFICSSFIVAQEKPQNDTLKNQEEVKMTNTKTDESKEKTVAKTAWNKVCPVKGNPVEEDSPTVEYNGKVYGFCCPGCDTKFAKNPEKYSKNLSEDGTRFIGRK